MSLFFVFLTVLVVLLSASSTEASLSELQDTETKLAKHLVLLDDPHRRNLKSSKSPKSSKACFVADALITMEDGSKKRISEVRKGDKVATGIGNAVGLVTNTLIHEIDETVDLVAFDTQDGPLLGTHEHPVFVQDEWVLFGTVDETSTQEAHVDLLYNLEINGDDLRRGVLHSYVVNGVIASGLVYKKEMDDITLLEGERRMLKPAPL